MANAASFAEILDQHLGCTDVPPAAPYVWSSRAVTAPLLGFEGPLASTRRATPFIETPRPLRLSAQECRTLDDAASLDALRHAYRTLARHYHPDRHQGCSPSERERLARLFAEATDHYRRLTPRFSPVQ